MEQKEAFETVINAIKDKILDLKEEIKSYDDTIEYLEYIKNELGID